ncbi:malic enzyme SfcA [Candidatus Termititenax persephonae]|uniref:Malic enzyme SfcA n=1 Tax=Candidatus Termititenax persephonae TaxID=2218525 RepID=A0A388TIU3_9BACT|nr:malic enzyme SfcA [Candidatus Termititenax persephonae]
MQKIKESALAEILKIHENGKINVASNAPIKDYATLSQVYTPGVAKVCQAVEANPALAQKYTIAGNTVAIVTDGTAVLGLGDIGALAGLPVMEGKAALFREFGGVNAFPILLDTKDTDKIVETILHIAPTFAGINLEDISAPRCFEIERRLKAKLSIPVFHDDQHGTAVVTLAGLFNALRVVRKNIEAVKIVINGAGAAGLAIAKLLLAFGARQIVLCDREGAIYEGRAGLNPEKTLMAALTNQEKLSGSVNKILSGQDVFIGVSTKDVLTAAAVRDMNKDSIVFAMANPDPEIRPELIADSAAVIATGRSDYPNQINNVLCFPGMFKGAFAARATDITQEMCLAAARAIAACVAEKDLRKDNIIPSVFDKNVAENVAAAVAEAWARREK